MFVISKMSSKDLKIGLKTIKDAIAKNSLNINNDDIQTDIIVLLVESGIENGESQKALLFIVEFLQSLLPTYKETFATKRDVLNYLKEFEATRNIAQDSFLLLQAMIKQYDARREFVLATKESRKRFRKQEEQIAEEQIDQPIAEIEDKTELLISQGKAASKLLNTLKGNAKKRMGHFDNLNEMQQPPESQEESQLTLNDCINLYNLPIIYRYWWLDDEESGLYSGVVLWSVPIDKKVFGDNIQRYGILWSDEQYTEEPIDDVWLPEEDAIAANVPIDLLEKRMPIWATRVFKRLSKNDSDKFIQIKQKKRKDRILTARDLDMYRSEDFKQMMEEEEGELGEEPFEYVEFVEEVTGMNLEHIRGDGRCEYRSIASELNYICTGNGRGEGRINWGVEHHESLPPGEEDAMSELIMLSAALAMRAHADDAPGEMSIRENVTIELRENFEDFVRGIRTQKLNKQQAAALELSRQNYVNLEGYVSTIINTPDTSGLSSLYYGGYNEMSLFFTYVMNNMLTWTLWSLRSIMDGIAIPTGSDENLRQGQINIINIMPISAHYEALYNPDRSQQRGNFNWSRNRLIAHIIGYIINQHNPDEIAILREKIRKALLKFVVAERGEIIQHLYDSNVAVEEFLGGQNKVLELLELL
jgi:hypothetical protein